MATKKKTPVNKTQLILNAVAKYPDAGPTDIAEKLKRYKITPAYVSTVKSAEKARGTKFGGKKSRKGRARVASVAATGDISVAELLKAKKIADDLGGPERAKVLIDAVVRLQD